MELTSREIATVAVTVGFVLLAFSLSNDRKGLLQEFLEVAKAFTAWKVSIVLLAYLAFLTGVVVVAYFLGVWSPSLLKDTVIIGFSAGLPILFNSTNFEDGFDVIKHVTKEVLSVAALLVLYINLIPFPLLGEVILQTFLLFAVTIVLVTKRDDKTAAAGKFFENLISLLVLGLIVYVTVQVINRFTELDWGEKASAFALSVWLPAMLIPFIYAVGLIASCEATLVRAKYHHDRNGLSLPVRLGFLVGVHGSLRNATSFTGLWLTELATQTSFRQTLRMMRQYRRSVRCNARGNR